MELKNEVMFTIGTSGTLYTIFLNVIITLGISVMVNLTVGQTAEPPRCDCRKLE